MTALGFIRDYLRGYVPYKSDAWCYEDGCVLLGSQKLYEATGDGVFRDFVLAFLTERIAPDGDIAGYETAQYNIDSVNCSKTLFFAYHETGEARYRKAIELQMERLLAHPRCDCGSFWHKTIYPYQVWMDGLYMAQPFYAQYEREFDDERRLDDIIRQYATVRERLYDAQVGLCYHAWDERHIQPWCDQQTGCSRNFWLRSIGWYLMSMIDVLEQIPLAYEPQRAQLAAQLREAVVGVLRYQDAQTGLFYQVVNHPEEPRNYLETSGSSMVAYTLYKGCRLGALDGEAFLPAAERAMAGLLGKLTDEGLGDICAVAGLGPGEKRDGSIAYYLSEPIVRNDPKGVGSFMMACAEVLLRRGPAALS